jgi:hypothetical protein
MSSMNQTPHANGAAMDHTDSALHGTAARAVVAIATACQLLLAAACGGHPSSTGSSASPSTGESSPSLLAYAQCMRAHGVQAFPDPDSSGLIPQTKVKHLTTSPTVIRAADGHCQYLYPTLPGINAPFSAAQRQDYLRAAACMRSHRIPSFPDPVFSGTQVQLPIPPGIDTKSVQFIRAQQNCARMIPAGLPYSGNPE